MMESKEIPGYDFFIDREKGRSCLVAGNAPTIRDFPFSRFTGVVIMTGTGPQMLQGIARPDYWVNANYYYPVPQRHLKDINDMPGCVFFFADSVAYAKENRYDRDFLVNNIRVPWFAFDERHFAGKKCAPVRPCCRLVDLYPGRITFQEYMENHFGAENISRGVGTTVLHSLALALVLGCNPVYIQGVELPLSAGDYTYLKASGNLLMSLRAFKAGIVKRLTGKDKPSDFSAGIETTLANFGRLADLGRRIGVDIYNLSPTSTLNRIPSLPYLDPQKVAL